MKSKQTLKNLGFQCEDDQNPKIQMIVIEIGVVKGVVEAPKVWIRLFFYVIREKREMRVCLSGYYEIRMGGCKER